MSRGSLRWGRAGLLGGCWLLAAALPAAGKVGDLSIAHVEITQGLQNAVNSVPLVSGKRTLVRVFPRLEVAVNLQKVSGRLHGGWRKGGQLEELPGSPLTPLNRSVVAHQQFSRRDPEGVLLFELPRAWQEKDAVELWVELEYPRSFEDSCESNNRFPREDADPFTVLFHKTRRARIGFLVPSFCRDHRCVRAGARVRTREAVAWLRAVFPLAQERVVYYPFFSTLHRWPKHGGPALDWKAFLSLLEAKALTSPARPDMLYAWLPGDTYDSHGSSNFEHAAFGNDSGEDRLCSRWRRTLAHEAVHTLLGSPNHLTRRMDDPLVGELGFDVEGVDPFHRRVMLTAPDCEDCSCCGTCGERLHDVMVEGKLEKDAWITESTYQRLFEHLKKLPREPKKKEASPCALEQEDGGTSGDLLVIRGYVTPEGGGFFPFLPQSPTAGAMRAAQEAPPGGPYEVRLVAREEETGEHKICETLAWTPAFVGTETPERETETFVFLVPRYRDLERIELRVPSADGAKTIAEVVRPPYTPFLPKPPIRDVTYEPPDAEATSLENDDEERPSGILRWHSNLDQLPETRAPVAQHIFYSRDGETWDLVAADLAPDTSEISLDLTGLPACESCRLKVVAANGFEMAEAVTERSYRQLNQPPLAMIVIPVAQEVTIPAGKPLRLVGAGYDAESSDELGELPPESLTWTVVETTQTWTGSPVEIVLEPGSYTIHLVATDPEGAKSPPAVVTVVVGEQEAEP